MNSSRLEKPLWKRVAFLFDFIFLYSFWKKKIKWTYGGKTVANCCQEFSRFHVWINIEPLSSPQTTKYLQNQENSNHVRQIAWKTISFSKTNFSFSTKRGANVTAVTESLNLRNFFSQTCSSSVSLLSWTRQIWTNWSRAPVIKYWSSWEKLQLQIIRLW